MRKGAILAAVMVLGSVAMADQVVVRQAISLDGKGGIVAVQRPVKSETPAYSLTGQTTSKGETRPAMPQTNSVHH